MSFGIACIVGISFYMVIIGFITLALFKSAGRAEEIMGYKISSDKSFADSQPFHKSPTESSPSSK
jgi:hypothetical protein